MKKTGGFLQLKPGLQTSNNERFVRYWCEVACEKFDSEGEQNNNCKWFQYNKGGEYRKWYGNIEHVVNWEHNGQELKIFAMKKAS